MALHLVRDRKPAELPATWEAAEGRTIQWTSWSKPLRFFICPPPPAEEAICQGCNEVTDYETSQGKLMPLPGEMVEEWRPVQSKRRPDLTHQRLVKTPMWPVIRLVAFRCFVCGHVEIVDEQDERDAARAARAEREGEQ